MCRVAIFSTRVEEKGGLLMPATKIYIKDRISQRASRPAATLISDLALLQATLGAPGRAAVFRPRFRSTTSPD